MLRGGAATASIPPDRPHGHGRRQFETPRPYPVVRLGSRKDDVVDLEQARVPIRLRRLSGSSTAGVILGAVCIYVMLGTVFATIYGFGGGARP